MKKYLFLFAATLAMGITGCQPNPKEDETPLTPELSVDATEFEVATEGAEELEFNITSNIEWTATANAEWINIMPDMGEGNSVVLVSIEENETYDPREGEITVEAVGEYAAAVSKITIPVTQDEKKAMIMGSDSKFEVGAEGGNIAINLSTNVAYEVKLGADWLTIEENTRALEEKVINVTVAANEGYDPREATITITSELGSDVVKVTQAESRTVEVEAGEQELIPAEGGQVKVSVTQNMKYNVECTVDWISQAKGSRALETDELTFDVAANAGAAVRTGYIVISSEVQTDSIKVAQAGNSAATVEIPDSRLNRILRTAYDANEDGDLQVSELQAVTELSLEYQKSDFSWAIEPVSDLTGIEYMTNLEKLNISGASNKITTINLSNFTKLKELRANNSKLKEIDLSNNTELVYLDLAKTQIAAIDLSNNTKITNLQLSANKLTTLDVSALKELKVLNVAYNELTAIDLSNNTALEAVYVNGNKLTELNVSALAGLKRLNCEHNKLTALNVATNSQLTLLNCGRNALTELKVSGLANLTNLSLPYNATLTSIDLSGLAKLRYLQAHHTGLTSLSTTGCPELLQVNVDNCALTSVDLSANAKLRGLVIDNVGDYKQEEKVLTPTKDEAGNNALTTLNLGSNPDLRYLYAHLVPSLTTINLAETINTARMPWAFHKDEAAQWTGGYFDDSDPSYFPDGTEFVDLSANGTSNCYIVNQPGTAYKFKATVKGNGVTALTGESSVIEPTNATVLWMVANITDEKPNEDGGGWPGNLGNTNAKTHLVIYESVEYRDGYVRFATPEEMINGNVIVVARDDDNNVLWSWHLWVLNGYDAAASEHFVTASGLNVHMMDRNIGATASPDRMAAPTQNEWTQARGFYYQWGRKDPFMGSCKVVSGYAPKIVFFDKEGNEIVGYSQYGSSKLLNSINVQDIEGSKDVYTSVAYSVANPNTFIAGNGDGSYSWVTPNAASEEPGTTGEWGKLWGNQQAEGYSSWDKSGVKTMYDPCPVGYRVPSMGHFRFITSHGDNAGAYYNKMAEWKYNCVEKLFDEQGNALNATNNVAPFGLSFYIKGSKTASPDAVEGAQDYGVAPEDKTTAFFPATGCINWSYSDKTWGTCDVTAHTNCVNAGKFYGYGTLFMKAQRNGEFFNNTNSASYAEQQAKALPVRCFRENEEAAE